MALSFPFPRLTAASNVHPYPKSINPQQSNSEFCRARRFGAEDDQPSQGVEKWPKREEERPWCQRKLRLLPTLPGRPCFQHQPVSKTRLNSSEPRRQKAHLTARLHGLQEICLRTATAPCRTADGGQRCPSTWKLTWLSPNKSRKVVQGQVGLMLLVLNRWPAPEA